MVQLVSFQLGMYEAMGAVSQIIISWFQYLFTMLVGPAQVICVVRVALFYKPNNGDAML